MLFLVISNTSILVSAFIVAVLGSLKTSHISQKISHSKIVFTIFHHFITLTTPLIRIKLFSVLSPS